MEDHPLVIWYAALKRAGSAETEGNDIVLGDFGGKRFALGVSDDSVPVLCCAERDRGALSSVEWTSAAMVFGHNDRDWIALSCKDVRVRDSEQVNPVPLRLWIPSTAGRLEGWRGLDPKRIRIGAMKRTRKGPPALYGETFAELPLRMIVK